MENEGVKNIADRYGLFLIYLFGSQAETGRRYLEGEDVIIEPLSDLDVAVAFNIPPQETMKTYGSLYKELSEIFKPFDMDLVFIQELNAIFQYEIIKGVRIYEKDGRAADEFEEWVMRRAEDLLFTQRILNREIMEAVEDGYFEFEYSPHP